MRSMRGKKDFIPIQKEIYFVVLTYTWYLLKLKGWKNFTQSGHLSRDGFQFLNKGLIAKN
jgi:hypothetical protein